MTFVRHTLVEGNTLPQRMSAFIIPRTLALIRTPFSGNVLYRQPTREIQRLYYTLAGYITL